MEPRRLSESERCTSRPVASAAASAHTQPNSIDSRTGDCLAAQINATDRIWDCGVNHDGRYSPQVVNGWSGCYGLEKRRAILEQEARPTDQPEGAK
eukprot:scaffold133356_cov94-Phaeocystis_antarctica.AAC.1